jgi:hypothetical protein
VKHGIYSTVTHGTDTCTIHYLLLDKTKDVCVRSFEIISKTLKVDRLNIYVIGLGTSKMYYSNNNNNNINCNIL